MDKLGMDLADGSSSDNKENPQESLCQAFQAMLTMNQMQETVPPVQQGVQRMPIHQPQVANVMNMQPPHPAGQVQYSQALQQLLQTLKSPNSPQQQEVVSSILKTYPELIYHVPALMNLRIQQRLQQKIEHLYQQQLQQLQQQQQQHQHLHQNPELQMQSMQQFKFLIVQQELLRELRLQKLQQLQQLEQQPQDCCNGLSEFQKFIQNLSDS